MNQYGYYENGEIIEVRNELHKIIKAIDTFVEQEN